MTSWLDTHLILIYVLLALAVWAGIKCLTTGQSKSSLLILGLALGGAGILILLRWYNGKLIKQAEEIQKQRDVLHKEIEQNKRELEELKEQDAVEQEKLRIQIETREKAREEMAQDGRDLQETIDDFRKKYNL